MEIELRLLPCQPRHGQTQLQVPRVSLCSARVEARASQSPDSQVAPGSCWGWSHIPIPLAGSLGCRSTEGDWKIFLPKLSAFVSSSIRNHENLFFLYCITHFSPITSYYCFVKPKGPLTAHVSSPCVYLHRCLHSVWHCCPWALPTMALASGHLPFLPFSGGCSAPREAAEPSPEPVAAPCRTGSFPPLASGGNNVLAVYFLPKRAASFNWGCLMEMLTFLVKVFWFRGAVKALLRTEVERKGKIWWKKMFWAWHCSLKKVWWLRAFYVSVEWEQMFASPSLPWNHPVPCSPPRCPGLPLHTGPHPLPRLIFPHSEGKQRSRISDTGCRNGNKNVFFFKMEKRLNET